jgi:hypothetical protein
MCVGQAAADHRHAAEMRDNSSITLARIVRRTFDPAFAGRCYSRLSPQIC